MLHKYYDEGNRSRQSIETRAGKGNSRPQVRVSALDTISDDQDMLINGGSDYAAAISVADMSSQVIMYNKI